MDLRVYEQYPGLSEAEVKALVDKWLARIGGAIAGEMERGSQGLTQRVRVLAERDEMPLTIRVALHLSKVTFMRFSRWLRLS